MRAAADATARDGVLVRVAVRGDRWAEEIPPAPEDADVSVSFSTEEAADLHGAALQLLGYRVVVVPPGLPPGEPTADFLVGRELIGARPGWSRALLERAQAAFDLALGPAAVMLAGVVRAHRPPRRADPRARGRG